MIISKMITNKMMKRKSHKSLLLLYQYSFCTPFAAFALFLTLCPAGAWSHSCSPGHRKLPLEHHRPSAPSHPLQEHNHMGLWACGSHCLAGVDRCGRFFWFLNLLFPRTFLFFCNVSSLDNPITIQLMYIRV